MSSRVEAVLVQDRRVVTAALAAVTVAAWAYTLAWHRMDMDQDGGMVQEGAMSALLLMHARWTLSYAVAMLAMWWVMMAAMMLPSATPLILLFAAVQRKQREANNPFVPSGVLVGGYFVVLAIFGSAD